MLDLEENLGIDDLLRFVQNNSLQDWDIYMTGGGCYIVDKEPEMTWDRVQELLDATRSEPLVRAQYVRNCHELRIRVSAKFSRERKVSPAPVLAVCGCPGGPGKHHDKRFQDMSCRRLLDGDEIVAEYPRIESWARGFDQRGGGAGRQVIRQRDRWEREAPASGSRGLSMRSLDREARSRMRTRWPLRLTSGSRRRWLTR